jgi:patatin-like phospholipase/acyl hydrolase
LPNYQASGAGYDCSILDAVLATMARPNWFPSATVGSGYSKEEMISGSVGFNNPTKRALEEAERLFGPEQPVSVVISLGSEQQQTHRLTKQNTDGLQEALILMALEGSGVTDDLAHRFSNSSFYHRLAVDTETQLCNVTGWSDTKLSIISSQTKTYMDQNISKLARVSNTLRENKGLSTIGQLSE